MSYCGYLLLIRWDLGQKPKLLTNPIGYKRQKVDPYNTIYYNQQHTAL